MFEAAGIFKLVYGPTFGKNTKVKKSPNIFSF